MLPGSKRCSLSCYRLQHHKTIIKLAGRWQAKPVNRFQRDTRRFIICFLRGQGQPGSFQSGKCEKSILLHSTTRPSESALANSVSWWLVATATTGTWWCFK